MGKKRIITKGEGTPGIASEKRADFSVAHHSSTAEERTGQQKRGNVYIFATYNNTLVTITDDKGNTVAWSSSGSMGFRGTRKATPYAAARAAESAAEKAKRSGIGSVTVFIRGIGAGRESAVRAIANYGIDVIQIKDITPLPHNGPRPKKVRRV